MFRGKQDLGNGRYRIPVDVVPDYRAGERPNEYHTMWNIRTLTLMSRANLIALDWEQPRSAREESDIDRKPTRVVRLLHDEHLNAQAWASLLEPVRAEDAQYASNSLRLIQRFNTGSACVAEAFREAYTINPGESGPSVSVARSCGGCAPCRQARREPYAGVLPMPGEVWPSRERLGDTLRGLMAGRKTLTILYAERDITERNRAQLARFLEWLFSQGIRCLVLPPKDWSWFNREIRVRPEEQPFLEAEFDPVTAPLVPSVIYLPSAEQPSPQVFDDREVTTMVLASEDTVDPYNNTRRISDRFATRRFAEICEGIGL
jgi:hypothetical protein